MMYLWIMLACVPGDLGMLEGALIPVLSQGRAAVDGAPKRGPLARQLIPVVRSPGIASVSAARRGTGPRK